MSESLEGKEEGSNEAPFVAGGVWLSDSALWVLSHDLRNDPTFDTRSTRLQVLVFFS